MITTLDTAIHRVVYYTYNMIKDLVWTPSGVSTGRPKSLAGKGESIVNFDDGVASLIT
jgi:hypothetical protein